MITGQVFKSQAAERGSCPLYVENSLRGYHVVGGADQEMVDRVTEFLNHLSVPAGDRRKIDSRGYVAGPAMNVDVATVVFEWDVDETGTQCRNPRDPDDPWHDLPNFTADVGSAWMVMDHMRRRASRSDKGYLGSAEWRLYVSLMSRIMMWHLSSEDAAFVICMSALHTIKTTNAVLTTV